VKKYLRSFFHIIKIFVNDYRPVLVLFITILGISALALYFPIKWNRAFLSASSDSPWGIITSIFIHSDIQHFNSNMIYFSFFVLIFILINSGLPSDIRYIRAKTFAIGVFASAIAANLTWITLFPHISAIGSSGAVYAAIGIVLFFSISNSIMPALIYEEFDRYTSSIKNFILWIVNIAMFVFIPNYIIGSPLSFIVIRSGPNTFIHSWSFILGILAAATHFIYEAIYLPGHLDWVKQLKIKL